MRLKFALLGWLALAAPALAQDDAAVVEQGRRVAIAGDCTACHTKPDGGAAFAGGYGIQSPFGAIYSTNITPSKSAGIGNYSEDDFRRVLRRGVRPDGTHLYPAMPYTAYAKMTDDDIHALFVFMKTVKPVDTAAPQTKLPFPFNVRASLAVWNLLFLDDTPMKPDPAHDAAWNRGNYLVNALEHCGACHTPRNLAMGEDGGRAFAGAQLGSWVAPNITSDAVSGIGGWSQDELVAYLRSGRVHGKAQAAGGMAEAVENSLQYLGSDDLAAIATYLRATKPIRDDGVTKAAFAMGAAVDVEPGLRGTVRQDSSTRVTAPDALYSGSCASCHGDDGAGSRDGAYPSLFHNTATGGRTADNLVSAVLFGVDRKVGGVHVVMPRFDGESRVQPLDDQQIASIATYVMANFGNSAVKVSAEDVAQARRGGPPAPLAFLSTALVPALVGLAALVVVLALVFWVRGGRRKVVTVRGADSDVLM